MINKLVIFAGPSGTGKTTIVKQIIAETSSLSFSVSATTRSPRHNEEHGREYYFFTEEVFKNKLIAEEFIEHEQVYKGTLYGTLKSEIDRIAVLGKHVIFDIDVKGALNIKKIFGDRALAILVKPPSLEVLKQRLLERSTETIESLEERVGKAQYELSFESQFDAVIVNDKLENSLSEARVLVNGFLAK